jgi:hypothetical protein
MPRLLSQREYAERIKVSPQYVNKLVREGKIELVDGRIDPKKADAMRKIFERAGRMIPVKRAKKSAAKKKPSKKAAAKKPASKPRRAYTSAPSDKPHSATRSFAAARAEREEWQAKLAQLDYEERCKRLLPADQVIAAQQRQNANFRSQLRKLARHAAPLVQRQRTPSEIEAVLLEQVDQLLETFARDPLGLKPIEQPSEAPIVTAADPATSADQAQASPEEIAADQVPAEVLQVNSLQENASA